MNYFELFDLPMSFEVDKKLLTSKYYALSKKYHPDNFSQGTGAEQDQAQEKSSAINKAYRALKNKQSRIKYVLVLNGVSFEEGKEQMPQEFLMEMMDINEAIMEYKMAPSEAGRAVIEKQVEGFEEELELESRAAMDEIDFSQPVEGLLQRVKEYYLKSKYLKRLLDNFEDRGVEM